MLDSWIRKKIQKNKNINRNREVKSESEHVMELIINTFHVVSNLYSVKITPQMYLKNIMVFKISFIDDYADK